MQLNGQVFLFVFDVVILLGKTRKWYCRSAADHNMM